jgi:predicted metalloprotease with PDZ domain
MKRKVLITILTAIILVSCSSAEQLKPTEKPISTVTLTFAPNPIATDSPTATPTPKPTLTPSPTPDYLTLGNPSEKTSFRYPSWLPSNHFAYDNENYTVFSKVLHGTEVIIAVHKDNKQPTSYHEKFAEFVWDTFHLNWEVFQGYPYAQYYVKVLSPKSNQDFVSSTAVGFVVVTNPQKSNIGSSWYSSPSEYRQLVTHEMFHAWNGEIIMDVGAHINHVRPEQWFFEGATHYYGYRGTPNDVAFYNYRFKDSWQRYTNWKGTKYDIPVFDMSKAEVTTNEWQYGQNAREKGACLFYLLDKDLMSMEMSLDDLMRYMYENYGLKGKRYSTTDVLSALNTLTNSDWSEFFGKYVYGTVPLPLDGKFVYLEH